MIDVCNVADLFHLVTRRESTINNLRGRCIEFMMQRFAEIISTEGFAELPGELVRDLRDEASRRGVTSGFCFDC